MKRALKVFIVTTGMITTIPLRAETLDDWYPSAVSIIQNYEGSTYDKVTNDFDLQGLSVGVLQWTVASGSFSELIKEIGADNSRSLARNFMPIHGESFIKIIDLSVSGQHKEAREATFIFHEMGVDRRTEKPKGIRVKNEPMKELQAWLRSPLVEKAQKSLIRGTIASTAKSAQDWKIKFGDKSPLTFPEFMFFFNIAVQGGKGSFADGSLAEATKLVRGGESYGDLKLRREELVNYLAEWLAVEWSQAHDARYYSDAKKNSEILKANSKKLTPTQIHLLYMKYVRASVGNTPYHLPFMNRGVIDIVGKGWVNQTHYDFSDVYAERKPLNK